MTPVLLALLIAAESEPALPAPPPVIAEPDEAPVRSSGGDPFGTEPGGFQAGGLSFRFLLQTRYSQAWADDSTNPYVASAAPSDAWAFRENYLAHHGDGWTLNRFFMRLAATPTVHLGFKAIVDFAELLHDNAASAVKQAYVEVKPIPRRLEITAGAFKIPFSTMELDPIASYEAASLGPTDDLLKDLGFAGRDVGAQVRVAPLSKRKLLQLYFGVFRGNAVDENASPTGTIAGRIESRPLKFLTVGASFADKPVTQLYERPFTISRSKVIPRPDLGSTNPYAKHLGAGKAAEVDLALKLGGLSVRGEGLMGDRVDLDTRYGAQRWWAAWGLAAFRFSAGPIDLMPVARVEWLDGDRDRSDSGQRLSMTAGLNFLFTDGIRLLLDVSRTNVQAGSPLLSQPKPLPVPTADATGWVDHPYRDLGNTKVTVQLQVVM